MIAIVFLFDEIVQFSLNFALGRRDQLNKIRALSNNTKQEEQNIGAGKQSFKHKTGLLCMQLIRDKQ